MRAALLAERQPHAHGRAVVAHDALDVERGGAVGAGEARGRLPGQLGQVAGERIEAAGLRAVLRLRLLHAGGYLVDGLIPGDALELAGAALACALHGEHDALVLVVRALPQRHAAQAGVRVVVAARHLAWHDAADAVVLDAGAQMAARRAVDRAAGALVGVALVRVARLRAGLGRRRLLLGRAARHAEAQGRRHGDPSRPLHEGAAGELAVLHEFHRSELVFSFHASPPSFFRRAARVWRRRLSRPCPAGRLRLPVAGDRCVPGYPWTCGRLQYRRKGGTRSAQHWAHADATVACGRQVPMPKPRCCMTTTNETSDHISSMARVEECLTTTSFGRLLRFGWARHPIRSSRPLLFGLCEQRFDNDVE